VSGPAGEGFRRLALRSATGWSQREWRDHQSGGARGFPPQSKLGGADLRVSQMVVRTVQRGVPTVVRVG